MRITARKLDPHEWDFDADAVPEPELVACCVWEYARESASIRRAVKYAKAAEVSKRKLLPAQRVHEPFLNAVNKAYTLLCLTGFDNLFWVGLPFPEPWQSVDVDERKKWADVRPEIPKVKFPPFQVTGDFFTVDYLHMLSHEVRNKCLPAVQKAVQGEDLDKNEAELRKTFYNPPPVSFFGFGEVQSFVAQINWRDCTDKKIKTAFNEWIVGQRPPTIPEPSGRGHKPIDWRKKLGDLGILRLMYETKVGNMKIYQPEAWQRYGCRGKRYWYTASERALKDFRILLRFLPQGELPLHADTKPGRAPCAN